MRSVIVTGAANGIGEAISCALVAKGFTVIAVDKDAECLRALGSRYPEAIRTIRADVRQRADINAVFQEIDSEQLFGLVNNAGIYFGKSLAAYTDEEISEILEVNLKGAILFSQIFGKIVLGRSGAGAIVNVSSIAIYGGSDPVYSASKAGLVGLSKACALQFAPLIRVNAVAPAVVETRMSAIIPRDVLRAYRDRELVKLPITAGDVANTVLFLLSDEARNITGTVFDINNGVHM